jgi:UDP-glucose 4-epimerase
MNYLVTGGAGFIGSHIAEYLIDHGHDVTVVEYLFSGKKENIRHLFDNPHFHFVQGSITDSGLLKDTFKNADGIFHQAAIPSVPRSIENPAFETPLNIQGSIIDITEIQRMVRCAWHSRTHRRNREFM